MLWNLAGTDDGNVDAVVSGLDAGMAGFTAVDDATDVAVVGFAVWQRSFAAQAGNYGRMIEHSTIALRHLHLDKRCVSREPALWAGFFLLKSVIVKEI